MDSTRDRSCSLDGEEAAENASALQEVLTHPDLLRDFEVRNKLGQGGMGALFVARQKSLDRDVALKFVLKSGAIDLARFNREGLLLSRLAHPNVLKIYAVEMFGRTPTLVLELLKGRTLKDEVAVAGPLPTARVRDLGLAILDGLAAAHDIGVIHRDLKTENLFLPEGGGVKILDFGLARESSERKVASITQAGTILGTPAYMSPELCQGHRVDARSDLYSLGVILFELASGKLPFSGEYPMELILKHIQEAPPALSSVAPGVPEALEEVVRIALSKKPSERFPSAGHFREALSKVPQLRSRATGKSSSRPVSRPIRSTLTGSTPRAPGRPSSSATGSPRATMSSGPGRPRWIVGAAVAGAALVLALATVIVVRPSRPVASDAPRSPAPPAPLQIEVTVSEGRIRLRGLPQGTPALVVYHPRERPDLTRSEVWVASGKPETWDELGTADAAGCGDLEVKVTWPSGPAHPKGQDTFRLRDPPRGEAGSALARVESARGDPEGNDLIILVRERAVAAGPVVKRLARGLVDLTQLGIEHRGGHVSNVLDAAGALCRERDPEIRDTLETIGPWLKDQPPEEFRPVKAWARCAASLQLTEKAPRIAGWLARMSVPPASAENVEDLAVALALLGGGASPDARSKSRSAIEKHLTTSETARPVLAALALLADPASAPVIGSAITPEKKAVPQSEQTWSRLLALGDIVDPRGLTFRRGDPLDREWGEVSHTAVATSRARLGSPPFGTAKDRLESRPEAAYYSALASLYRAVRSGTGPTKGESQRLWSVAKSLLRTGSRRPDAETWAAALAVQAAAVGETSEQDVCARLLDESLSQESNGARSGRFVDPVEAGLVCLGGSSAEWEGPVLDRVVRIAASAPEMEGAAAGDGRRPPSWASSLRAIEALAAHGVKVPSQAPRCRDAVVRALASRSGHVRWAALCGLARLDREVATALALPGAAALQQRIDPLGVWHRTGIHVGQHRRLRLAAYGAWWIAREQFPWTDPDGYSRAEESEAWKRLDLGKDPHLERWPRMALEGRVGSHGFRAGRFTQVVTRDEGELLLRPHIPFVNLDSGFYAGSILAWLARLHPNGREGPGTGMRGFVTVAIEDLGPDGGQSSRADGARGK